MKATILLVAPLVGAALAALGSFGCGQTGSGGSGGKETSLPAPKTEGGMSVAEAIAKRRSVREFTAEGLTIEQISQLAWSAQGITDPSRGYRAAPSAGATYPLELYLLSKDGVFRYVPQGHKLVQVSDRDCREELSKAALGQSSVAMAPLTFVMAAIFSRTEGRYGERARQYVYMEAGHVAENIHLQAVALGLGSVPVGAFRDRAVSEVLRLPADEEPVYMVPVGHPK